MARKVFAKPVYYWRNPPAGKLPKFDRIARMAYRRQHDRAYDLACKALAAESPVIPDDEVIEARASQYRIYLQAETMPDAETLQLDNGDTLDLKEVQAAVSKQVAAKKRAQRPAGVPRPKEVLRRGKP